MHSLAWVRASRSEPARRKPLGQVGDFFWLKDQSREEADSLSPPDVLAQEIADALRSALNQFAAIAAELKRREP